jgi:hypothetical protein
VLTIPALAENVADVDPWGTVTEAGMFAAAGNALSAIVAPPLNAAEVSATVQVDPRDGVSDAGLHEMELKEGVWAIVTVPPVTDVGIPAPVESTERPLVS